MAEEATLKINLDDAGVNLRERVMELEKLITASKDNTFRLEKQLRIVREVCPHNKVESTTIRHLYLQSQKVETTDSCAECGKIVRRELVEIPR